MSRRAMPHRNRLTQSLGVRPNSTRNNRSICLRERLQRAAMSPGWNLASRARASQCRIFSRRALMSRAIFHPGIGEGCPRDEAEVEEAILGLFFIEAMAEGAEENSGGEGFLEEEAFVAADEFSVF